MRLRARFLLGGAAAGTAAAVACGVWIALPLPPGMLDARGDGGVVVEDRAGLPLHTTRAPDGSRASWASYDRIDADVINAFVAVEDRRFWEHHGVDLLAVTRAVRDNVASRRVVSGASTITMQLARLLRPGARSLAAKAAQGLWALRIERHLGKQQIMEQYLNRVHLGQATVGIGAAAALYFGASPSELSIAQAATLAGLAHAPSRDNPHAAPRRARARRDVALDRMRRLGTATAEDLARARAEPVFRPVAAASLLAPHFTTRVLAELADAPGAGRVRTSLDLALQTAVQAEVRHTTQVLADRGVKDAAVVVIDNASGEVLAWVGSPDFWDARDGQTDMVTSARQPGSALKPFVYALALDRGYTAASGLPDVPRSYATATGPYQPRNYDRRFRGPVRAREALASSYNVPAVELAARLGAANVLHTLRDAGFTSLRRDADHYGLGIALGNGDVTLLELANAYRSLASGGTWRPWTWRLDGAAPAAPARRVASPVTAAIVLDMLSDADARIPGFGTVTPFDFPFPVAVKTGTSRHFTDNWAVGVTGRFTVAVWAGNFSGRPMAGVSGVTGAGPLLHRVVLVTAARYDPGVLPTPAEQGARQVRVCRLSGLRVANGCEELAEWFAPGTEPARLDDWERDGRVALPAEYAEWAGSLSRPLQVAGFPGDSARPADADMAVASGFRIVSPLDGDRYFVPAGVEGAYATIALRAVGPGADRVRWYVDGRPHAGSRWAVVPGEHRISARSPDGERREVRVVVD